MNTKRKHDRTCKECAVKLSYERRSITEGILLDRIYSWRKEFGEHGATAFHDHGVERFNLFFFR